MNRLINSRVGSMFLTLIVLSGAVCYAGVEDFQLSVRNLTQPTPNRIEFDIYLLDTDPGQPFELSGCQIGLLLNSLIYNGGVLSVAIDNTGSGMVPDQQFLSAPDVVSSLAGYPGLTLIRLAGNTGPPIPPGAGSGTVISTTGYGTLLTHFIVTSTVDFTPNSTPDLNFTSGSAVSPLYPTKVNEYIDAIDTQLTVSPGVNAIVDGNPLLNATLPMAFNVTGSGSYCVGGNGLTVGLDDSEADVTYTLFRNGLIITSMAGDGDAITFGLRLAGIYTVEGTNLAGTVTMNGQAEIIAVVNTVTPGSSAPTLCIGTLLTSITHTTTGATGIGSPMNLPSGVTAAWSANTITISGTPTASGVFNYSIPLTGGCGTVSATGTITVNPLPVPAGTITGTASVCQGQSGVTYNIPAIANATSYQWTYSGTGASITGTTNAITISFAANATSGNITVRGVNTCGNGTLSVNYPVTVNTLPVTSTITGDATPPCSGTGYVYRVTNTARSDYAWSVPVGATITSGQGSHNITVNFGTTNGNITVTETNASLCVGSPGTLAISLAGCGLDANFSGTPLSVCVGSAVTFTDISVGTTAGTSYSWNFGSGASPATGNTAGPHSVTYSTSGLKTVTLTITEGASNTETKTNYITVNPIPSAPVAGSNSPICAGTTLTLTASTVTGATYNWTGPNGFTTTVQNPSIATATVAATGTYSVTVTVNGCASGAGMTTATVNSIPTITGVTSGSRCGTGTVTLGATASAGTINWYSAITGGSSLGTGPSYTTPSISGTTTYYVDATNNGCTTPTRTMVLAIVNTIPTITNTTPASRCGTGTVILGATPSAGTVNWYTVPSGGISVGTGTTFTTPDLSSNTTYWVDATNAGCTTPSRTSVIATVNLIPSITGTTPDSRCATGTVTLGATASAGTINWYSAAIGGVSLGSGISFTTPPLSTTTTYWVDATNLGCTSTLRTSVVATINPVPAIPVHTVDCSLGFNHAGITVTSPVGAGYQYRLNSGSYQISPVFTEVINGSYTVTVINSSNCTATGTSFDVSCGCVNGPTMTLSSISGSTCGTAPITVINNSFGGSATSVTIIENGAGTISPAGTAATPFAFTYTPAAGDTGNTVTITVTTNNPLGVPCAAAFATYTLTVNAVPAVSGTTPGSRCGTGTLTLGATASAGTVNWYSASTGGGSIGTGSSFTTPVISATTTYYVDATNNGCTTAGRTPVIATVLQAPSAAGSIIGSATFTPGTAGVPYSVASITGATGYFWSYSGTGVTINGSGTSITLDFAANATSGSLSVYGTNTCGQGTAATLTLSSSNKTLTLTSVLLEGLYNGSGTMRQAQNASGAQWPAGVADHITVELHNGSNYATIVWSQTDVSLSTAGTAVITVPAIYNGSYYITVKHRNSIETTTVSPVSFAGTVINRLFGSAAGIYGANLRASGDGYSLIFGGDVNQDGYVDSGDYPDVVNDNFNYISGYLPTDINGDGFIDSGDYPIMVNNNLNYIGTIHP